MTRREISRRILKLLDCDGDEIVDAILELANEVEEDYASRIADHDCYYDLGGRNEASF